jgi:D-arabinose 1-dehydrogenase-like Zn-dependent alcohol dehydrogenase
MCFSGIIIVRIMKLWNCHARVKVLLNGRCCAKSVLKWTPIEVGEPAPGQVRLRQAAAALGATVIGTAATEAKTELAHAHGCSHAVLYTKQDFVAEVSRISGGAETVGGLRFCRQEYIPALTQLRASPS